MKNYKTPLEQVFFRSSKIGLLAGGLIRHGLTVKQREELDTLELMQKTPVGLTEKQAEDLMTWDKKVEAGGTLTPAQMEKRDDYRQRLVNPRELTPTQQARLQELQERNSRPPELSDGAKTYVKEVWLENEKGFVEEVTDKKLRKGKQGEEDAINLISYVDDIMYVKNEERKYKNNLTGECDVNFWDKDNQIRIVHDTKCSWNPRTFMAASLTTGYEWQGRAYMYLYDADIFCLRHCLVDCPPEVLMDEYKKFCYIHGIIDDSLPEYQPLIEQFNRNYLYEDSPLYTREERVKTFLVHRDYELEEIMLTAVKLGIEYYKTITLNMK